MIGLRGVLDLQVYRVWVPQSCPDSWTVLGARRRFRGGYGLVVGFRQENQTKEVEIYNHVASSARAVVCGRCMSWIDPNPKS